jgi:hypothetical protein
LKFKEEFTIIGSVVQRNDVWTQYRPKRSHLLTPSFPTNPYKFFPPLSPIGSLDGQ